MIRPLAHIALCITAAYALMFGGAAAFDAWLEATHVVRYIEQPARAGSFKLAAAVNAAEIAKCVKEMR